ncbi:MAG: RNA recognition motif-containing protein [Pleopsidium flavum]|nr:MAG: RNA recognition motif-containing protein [Pleopsidium flavum]
MGPQRKKQRISSNGTGNATKINDCLADGSDSDAEDGSPSGATHQRKRSLFVRSLSSTVTTETLTQYFSQSFPIKHATVVVDPVTKQSKGYGFVTFADAEDAKQAEKEYNGKVLESRKIKVETAEPRHRHVEGNDAGGLKRKRLPSATAAIAKAEREKLKAEAQQPPKLIIRNLPWSVKEPEQLAMLFRSYGKVKHVAIPKRKPGVLAGFGFVVMRGRKNAERALSGVNGKELDGRTLAVDWAVEKEVWEDLQRGDVNGAIDNEDFQSNVANEDGHESMEPKEEIHGTIDGRHAGDAENSEIDVGRLDSDDLSDDEDQTQRIDDTLTTLFVRNLPFTSTDETLFAHFSRFGFVRYARAVVDHATERSKGTGFVCFYNGEDADGCLRQAPIQNQSSQVRKGGPTASLTKHSVLENTTADPSGRYTMEGRVLQVSRAVSSDEATRLTGEGSSLRDKRDRDKRRLYLLSEGTVPSNSPLYDTLAPSEVKMREASAKQRHALIKSNPTLHISLTRLSIRNIPRGLTSKDLKALAREAVVGFAKDVKRGARSQLSKEELERGSVEMKEAERNRKAKGKGIVRQAKIVFEGREGGKVTEDSGAGRSRGYGFVEYVSHRCALMGLRWLNGHAVGYGSFDEKATTNVKGDLPDGKKRLIVEFAIENAQVVGRRQEREAKARERSKTVADKIGKGALLRTSKKALSKDALMAKTRKGAKRNKGEEHRNGSTSEAKQIQSFNKDKPGGGQSVEASKMARREQIIAKKRLLRRSKRRVLQG